MAGMEIILQVEKQAFEIDFQLRFSHFTQAQ